MIQILLGLAVFLVGAALLILIFAGFGLISKCFNWNIIIEKRDYKHFWPLIGEGGLVFILFLGACWIIYLIGLGIYLLGGGIIESICNSAC